MKLESARHAFAAAFPAFSAASIASIVDYASRGRSVGGKRKGGAVGGRHGGGGTRTRTNTIPNGTKANAAGLSGMRAIAQKGENGRRGVVGGGVGHHVDNRQR